MSCKVKFTLTKELVDKGAIDEKTKRIKEYGLFEKLNNEFTQVAYTKYNVGNGETKLFSPYYNGKYNVAEPNEYLMEALDESREIYNAHNKEKSEEEYKFTKLNSLINDSKDPIFVDQKEKFTEEENSVESYTSTNNHVLFDSKQGKFTAAQVLQNILKNYDNLTESGQQYLSTALLLINKTGAKVKFVSKSALGEPDSQGKVPVMAYNALNNEIMVSRDVIGEYDTDTMVETFLHEVVHSVTVKAYAKPSTLEEKEFRDFIRKEFRFFKENSDNSDSYGFTNEAEFIAEIFTNPKFQQEIKTIEKNNLSIWDRFVNAIRKLFKLGESQKFLAITEAITSIANSKQTGNVKETFYKRASDSNFTKPKTDTIDDRLERTVELAKGNLQQALNRSKKAHKQNESRKEFQKHMEELIESMDKYTGLQQWKAVTTYVKSLAVTVKNLEKKFAKEDFANKDILQTINSYEEYLATFDMIDQIEKLRADAEFEAKTNSDVDIVEVTKMKAIMKQFKSKHKALVDDFVMYKAKHMSKVIANSKYLTQVETDWRIKLEKEYRDKSIVSESKTEWVTRQMNTTYKVDIQNDLDSKAREVVEGTDYDITKAVSTLADPLNTNGKLFQIVVNMVADMRNNINERILEYDYELDALKKKLEEEKGTKRPSELYKNILEQDKEGNWYVKGSYSTQFLVELDHAYGGLTQAVNEIVDKYKAEGLTDEEIKKKEDYIEANTKRWNWMKENTIKYGIRADDDGNPILNDKGKKTYLRRATNNWKNDLSKLSDTEKAIRAKYIQLINKTTEETDGKQSLIKERFGAKFYKLPAITKSDMERVIERKTKGMLKDKAKDLTSIRTDDIGFDKEAVDGKGNPLRRLKIHFRGTIDSDQQSLDLLTMMRMERLNGINYSEKAKVERQLRAIEDISGNKEYYKISKKTGKVLRNIFRVKEDVTTFRGKEGGNEYNRIKSYLEGSLYDVLHDHAGTAAGMDINKIIQHINGTTAFIGMSVNIGSGLANLTNGFSQLFIEAMGSDHISWKSLIKAEKKYTMDLPNILADLSNPVKKSFTNQVIQMFDVYGGFSVTDHPFLKDTLAKKLGNAHTLSGLQEMGEHMLQGILAMAVLDNLKVMNENHKYIDKDGNEVDEKKAASYLDMLRPAQEHNVKETSTSAFLKNAKNYDIREGDIVKIVSDGKPVMYKFHGGEINKAKSYKTTKSSTKGKLRMDDRAVFSKHNRTLSFKEGGKAHVTLLIKKKIHDTMGAYDPNLQNELYRTWYGKLLMMFKRFLIPGLQHRFKGISTSTKSKDKLGEDDIAYNTSIKQYEEGTYVTFLRFIVNGLFPAIKNLGLHHTKEYWKDMSDYERANLKKATVEVVIAFAIVPMLAALLEASFEDDEDDEMLWFAAYQLRRLESELSQYLDISEAWRITKNPIAGTKMLQNTIEVLSDLLTPWNLLEEDSKGQNEFVKDIKRVTPIWIQLDKQWKQSYNFINNQAN